MVVSCTLYRCNSASPRPLYVIQVLDEPAADQSDVTVLELQLRAISKKQHGDVAVRCEGLFYCGRHQHEAVADVAEFILVVPFVSRTLL